MEKIITIILICFAINFGLSQTFTTEHSAHFTKESVKDKYHIIFPSAYGFMTLHYLDNVMMDNTKGMVLTKYDQTMKSLETTTFNLPKLGNRAADLVELIELEDKLIVISKSMHKKLAKHEVYAQVYSQKDNTVSEKQVLASFEIDGYSKSGYYQVAVSPDQQKIAILANMPFVKKTKEVVKVWLYDTELNKLWEQKETLSYDSERAYNEKVFLKNSGEAILSKTTDAYKKTRKTELLTFSGSQVETHPFSDEGFMPMNMALTNVNGRPMLTGFFWDGKNSVIKINSEEGEDNNGAFLFSLQENKLIGIHLWNEDLKNPYDYKSLEVIDVIVKNNDIFLCGEKQLVKSEFRKNGNTPTTEMDYFYTYGPGLIVNFDTNGTLKSFTPVSDSRQHINHEKEKGSLKALFLENALRIFSNRNGDIIFDTYYTENKGTFNPPMVNPTPNSSSTVPALIPQTVRPVKDYALIYYITNYGDKYWLNKMTW
jgi:hypothetical protein